jgi:chromosome segregation ATPase
MTEFLEKIPPKPPYQKIEKMEKTLEEINTKLDDALKKSDQSWITDLIKETVTEMKKAILESVEQRVLVLEGEIHALAVQNDKLHNELKGKTKEINHLKENATDCAKLKEKIVNQNSEMQALKENNQTMRDRLNREFNYNEGAQNDAEQYSRMNNIRLYGLKEDDPKQTSA